MSAKYAAYWYTCDVTWKVVDCFFIVSKSNFPGCFAYNTYALKWLIFIIPIDSDDSKYSKITISIRKPAHSVIRSYEVTQILHENEFSNLCFTTIIHIMYQ